MSQGFNLQPALSPQSYSKPYPNERDELLVGVFISPG